MSRREDLSGSNKEHLIRELTSRDWGETNGGLIGAALKSILVEEIASINSHPELWSLPRQATIKLPQFDSRIMETATAKWRQVHINYQNPHRFLTPIAQSRLNGLTMVKFDAYLSLLSQNIWTAYFMLLDGIGVPLKVDKEARGAQINPKPKLLSDEDFERLCLSLAQAIDGPGETDEAEALAGIRNERNMIDARETLVLNLLFQDPKMFARSFSYENMVVTSPERLMSDDEVEEWYEMVKAVVRESSSREVVVGIPGYGSYARFEGQFQFDLGLTLLRTALNADGSKSSTSSIHVPAPVLVDGKRVGWFMVSVNENLEYELLNVDLDHGADDMYWFNIR